MTKTKLRDSILASVVIGIILVAAMYFDAFERFAAWARRYDRWQVDELIFLPVLLVLALIFFRWRKHSELPREAAERRRAEARYRALVENIPAVVYTQRPGQPSLTTYISPQIEVVAGYSPREILADPRHWIQTLHPEDRERVLAEDRRTNETGEPFRMEYRQRTRDGEWVWVRDEAVLVRDEEGEPLFWQGVLLDITERKLAVEKLEEANRRLEELGSPLATIRGFLDMLATRELEQAEEAAVMAKIRSETDRLSTLVADVRSGVAIERDGFTLLRRRTSVGEIFEDATRFAETLAGDHPLTVEIDAEEHVLADRYRIGRVLRNLLSNAAKYSPDGAPIELRATPGGRPGRVRLEVADHGPGIDADEEALIFEKYSRGRDGSDPKAYGVGLGLYVSRRIVRAHGSELTVGSVPGGGTLFSFELGIAR